MIKLSLFLVLLFLSCSFGGFITFNYGGRANRLYVPDNYKTSEQYPLFVMLHGCTQNPDDFAAGTQMNKVGESMGFLVLYPLQPSSANMNKCWNWFEPAHQSRGSGEPAFIAGATQAVIGNYSINTEQVFIAGLSAGGAMTAIMGAAYSDIYTGIGINAGLEYKAATSTVAALEAMRTGGPDPTKQAGLAWNAMSKYYKWPILTLVVQGTSDYTVYPVNGDQCTVQWILTNNFGLGTGRIPTSPTNTHQGTVPGGRTYVDKEFADFQTGAVVVRYITVNGMGHAWSGGSTSGSYTDPKGPDSSTIMAQFFLQSDPPTPTPVTPTPTPVVPTPTPVVPTPTPVVPTPVVPIPTPVEPTPTPTPSGTHLHIPAIPNESGFVGQLAADGYQVEICKVGDKGMYNVNTYYTIFSFPTSAIPQNAVIEQVSLTVEVSQSQGKVNSVSVDIKSGDFGGSPQLKPSDYNAAADGTNIITDWDPVAHHTITIPNQQFQFINKNGRTHLRLKGLTTPSFSENTMYFSCASGSTQLPTLSVYYT